MTKRKLLRKTRNWNRNERQTAIVLNLFREQNTTLSLDEIERRLKGRKADLSGALAGLCDLHILQRLGNGTRGDPYLYRRAMFGGVPNDPNEGTGP
jgi:hypothetical protein